MGQIEKGGRDGAEAVIRAMETQSVELSDAAMLDILRDVCSQALAGIDRRATGVPMVVTAGLACGTRTTLAAGAPSRAR